MMSDFQGERGDSGLQGVAGERGPKGDHGQHGDIGETGSVGAQGVPGKNARIGRWSMLRLIAFVAVAAAAIFSSARTFQIADQNRTALEQIKREGVERRDQICLSTEREHLTKVSQLIRTYAYIDSLPDTAFDKTPPNAINLAVLTGLPQTEEAARTDVAPAFCDETLPGGKPVGLPEPDPIVPARPKRIDRLLKEAVKTK
jgi:hypothetical protein